MGSTSTTWSGKRTANSSDDDQLDEALGELVRAAQHDLDGSSAEAEPGDRGELVERQDSVSYVLLAPGYSLKDFLVEVVEGELRVDAPGFGFRRELGCRVDAAGIRTDYRNGVLSVRIGKS